MSQPSAHLRPVPAVGAPPVPGAIPTTSAGLTSRRAVRPTTRPPQQEQTRPHVGVNRKDAPAREQKIRHLSAQERRVVARFGQRVRGLRRQRNTEALAAGLPKVTIAVLAHAAGINAAGLGEIERGRVNPSLMVLTRIARALDVTLAVLLDHCDGHNAGEVRDA